MNSQTECVAAAKQAKQAKHSILLDELSNLRSVNHHLDELKDALGVASDPRPANDLKESSEPSDLVSVLNMLPGAIKLEVSKAHHMINEISAALL